MNEPQLLEKPFVTVAGISVRTLNRDEANPETAKLAAFWAKLRNENIPASIPGALANSPVYGVYSNYESDESGYYTVTAGVEVALNASLAGFTRIEISSGHYLVFSAKGSMPEIVIKIWQRIWAYFADESIYLRRFNTDFEVYSSAEEVEIYIGVDFK